MKKDSGPLSPAVADLRLTFLRIICDHDKYVEFPGRAGNERNYVATLLQQEVLGAVVSEDPLIRCAPNSSCIGKSLPWKSRVSVGAELGRCPCQLLRRFRG